MNRYILSEEDIRKRDQVKACYKQISSKELKREINDILIGWAGYVKTEEIEAVVNKAPVTEIANRLEKIVGLLNFKKDLVLKYQDKKDKIDLIYSLDNYEFELFGYHENLKELYIYTDNDSDRDLLDKIARIVSA